MSPLRVGTVFRWIAHIDYAMDAGPERRASARQRLQALRDDLLLLSVGEEIVDVTQPPAPPEEVP